IFTLPNIRSSSPSNPVKIGDGAMSMKSPSSSDWPELAFSEWESTCDTVHMWTQIVGKTRMAFDPLVNHWWNVPLYVSPVGLTTSAIPYHAAKFDIEFDFVAHQLTIRTGDGR